MGPRSPRLRALPVTQQHQQQAPSSSAVASSPPQRSDSPSSAGKGIVAPLLQDATGLHHCRLHAYHWGCASQCHGVAASVSARVAAADEDGPQPSGERSEGGSEGDSDDNSEGEESEREPSGTPEDPEVAAQRRLEEDVVLMQATKIRAQRAVKVEMLL